MLRHQGFSTRRGLVQDAVAKPQNHKPPKPLKIPKPLDRVDSRTPNPKTKYLNLLNHEPPKPRDPEPLTPNPLNTKPLTPKPSTQSPKRLADLRLFICTGDMWQPKQLEVFLYEGFQVWLRVQGFRV